MITLCVHMLQVNSVIDVGVSAYSQLQKLKGQEIDATDSDKAKKNVRVGNSCIVTICNTVGICIHMHMYSLCVPC